MMEILLLVPFQKNPKPISPIIKSSIQRLNNSGITPIFTDPKKHPNAVYRKNTPVYDRYPSLSKGSSYLKWRKNHPDLIFANALPFIELCQNKIKTQQCLESEIKTIPPIYPLSDLPYLLQKNILLFIKPIFGSAGKGILLSSEIDQLVMALPK